MAFNQIVVGRPDPMRNMKFNISVPGIPALFNMGFSKVSGLSQEAELIEYREGDETLAQHKIPGLVKTGEATFERGVSNVQSMDAMLAWKEAASTAMSGPADGVAGNFRYDTHVQILNRAGLAERELVLMAAWPRMIEYGDLDANASDIWIATFTLVYEALVPGPIPASVASMFGLATGGLAVG